MNTRARLALVASLPIVALFCLLIFAPPDGLERASLAQFFGHFHPLAVHMPIALLLLVPLMEIAGVNERRRHIHAAAAFVLGLFLIAAIVTPLLGWLLAWSAGYEGALVTRHMWGGASLAAACWLTWLLRGHSGRLYAIALVATVGLVAWIGYLGGQLAHGEEHLTQHMPQALRSLFGLPAIPGDGAPDGDPATFYGARVAPILREHCLQRHGQRAAPPHFAACGRQGRHAGRGQAAPVRGRDPTPRPVDRGGRIRFPAARCHCGCAPHYGTRAAQRSRLPSAAAADCLARGGARHSAGAAFTGSYRRPDPAHRQFSGARQRRSHRQAGAPGPIHCRRRARAYRHHRRGAEIPGELREPAQARSFLHGDHGRRPARPGGTEATRDAQSYGHCRKCGRGCRLAIEPGPRARLPVPDPGGGLIART